VIRPDLLADHESTKQVALLLDNENETLHKRIAQLVEEVAQLRGDSGSEQLALELATIKELSDKYQKMLFGDSSESRGSGKSKASEKKADTNQHRQEKLDIVDIGVVLSPDDNLCDCCGKPLIEMVGVSEDSERVNVVERKFVLQKIKRQKYRCQCRMAVVTATAPLQLVAGGRYSPEFAVHVAVEKYLTHMPLDRQRRSMQRLGLHIHTSSLWDQINALAALHKPSYDRLQDYILGADVVGVDETWWRLLDKKPNKRWWVWSMTIPNAVWYGIAPSRSAKTAMEFIGDFEGTLVCDAYKAYESVAKNSSNIVLALCWSHARRKFVEAEQHYPQCAEAIDLIGELFAIDRETDDPTLLDGDVKVLAMDARQRARSERAPPILDRLREWCLSQRGLPKSGLRKAIDYTLGHWKGLTAFLSDPFVPLTNNQTERAMRSVVLGRKNHLGSKSKRGTEVAAILYSLVETAYLNGLDPYKYLVEATYAMLEDPTAVPLPLAK
jgi:transposase